MAIAQEQPTGSGDRGGALARSLCEVLDEQRILFEGLVGESVRQGECIARDDAEGLLDVLSSRQELIDRIQTLSRRVATLRVRWDEEEASMSESDREQIRSRFGVLDGLVEQISARDEADRKRLEDRRGKIAQELGSVVRGRGALSAYGASSAPTGARYQDRQG